MDVIFPLNKLSFWSLILLTDNIYCTVSVYQEHSPVHSSYLILLPNDGFYLPQPDTFYAPPALYIFSLGL